MSPVAISLLVFLCVFGGSLIGNALRALLPEHHLTGETKDVIKGSIALIGTMSALVLGILVGAAKGTFDTQKDELTALSSKVASRLTSPTTPASMHASMTVSASATPSATTGVRGRSRPTSRTISALSSVVTSMRTTSGEVEASDSTAPARSDARPAIAIEGCCENTSASPSR